MNIDAAKLAFDELFVEILSLQKVIANEQDTRFQIIDRLLVEVLGWPRSKISTEKSTANGFVDYLLGEGGAGRVVVEAKRIGAMLVDIRDSRFNFYKAGGPALASARDGLEQAQRYCVKEGVVFSVLTSGTEWIGFWAVREGKSPIAGMAAVFPTLESVDKNFAEFFQLFSYEGVRERLFQVLIGEAEGARLRPVEPLESAIPASDAYLVQKAPLATDLLTLFRKFFTTISGEKDPELLARCFVESKESREADITLDKIAHRLVSSIDVIKSGRSQELQDEIREAADSKIGEFVLIVGNKGAGKSTFIDRFFRLVIEKPLRERCIVLRIDLADFSGDPSSLHNWLTRTMRTACEGALFHGGMPSYEDLQGAYFDEYERWAKGPHKFLYQRDRNAFKEQFGDWLQQQTEGNMQGYVLALLRQAVRSRKLLPCLVFDNADHHRQEIQDAVFQYAQSLYRTVLSFVICPVTDRTIWQLSKSGPLQSYDHRSFYLPVPSAKEVVGRRISFLQEKVSEEKESASYFTERGIRLTISNINAFATCLEQVFITEEYIGRIVGWLSNHDIRRSLLIAQRIITSPWTRAEELVKAYVLGQDAHPRRRDTIRALIAGEYNHFDQSHSDFIINLFAVDPEKYSSPLTRLSILQYLIDRHVETSDVERLYVAIDDVESYFEPCAIARGTIRSNLQQLLNWRLIEPYDPTNSVAADGQRVRITHSGRLHHEFAYARQEASYLSEMALMTPIREQGAIAGIRKYFAAGYGKLQWEDWELLIWEFVTYLIREDLRTTTIPAHSAYENQRRLRAELDRVWRPRRVRTA